MGKAHIYEQDQKWLEAYECFSTVFLGAGEEEMRFEARGERAWCLGNIDRRTNEALDELHEVAALLDQDVSMDRTRKAQAWWRYGLCLRKIKGWCGASYSKE